VPGGVPDQHSFRFSARLANIGKWIKVGSGIIAPLNIDSMHNGHNDPFTILVVEDNAEELILLQRAFKRTGMDIAVHFVGNGEEAIDYLSGVDRFRDRASYPEPDLVIMDLKMPRKGGFEVLEWFRNLQESALIPIIVLTASNREADVQRAYTLGASSYFIKPTGFDEFRDMIKVVYDYWSLARRPRPLSLRH
jgi:CheY-like chemotaxis protein